MQSINGKALAAQIKAEVKEEIKRLGLTPGLAVILVGDNPASHLYVSLKEKACREVGIKFEKYVFAGTAEHTPPSHPPIPPLGQGGKLPKSSPPFEGEVRGGLICGCEQCVIEQIQKLNARQDIHGILVQVPLPTVYEEDAVISTIDPKKDVDGFHQVNLRAILENKPRIIPAVALGIVALIDEAARTVLESQGQSLLAGHKAIIIANRMEFAAPIEYLLEERGALVHIILRPKVITPDIVAQLKAADVLVVARGHANFVNGNMIKDGAIVIDVGTNTLPDGKVVGDVDFESTREKSGFITPIPGGVGPMTVAMLLKNTLELAKISK